MLVNLKYIYNKNSKISALVKNIKLTKISELKYNIQAFVKQFITKTFLIVGSITKSARQCYFFKKISVKLNIK